MKERPILFTGEMVRAILEGRKTQTRRLVLKSVRDADYDFDEMRGNRAVFRANRKPKCGELLMPAFGVNCPYEVGMTLWIKETFGEIPDDGGSIVYRATDPDWETTENWKWKPSIFMPRALSRITLEITGIRVERLQDISEQDAVWEGIKARETFEDGNGHGKLMGIKWAYQNLWESINGKGSWAKNPWVWVITFRKMREDG